MSYRTAFIAMQDIDLGDRGRKAYNRIEELADSIKEEGGLINPITLVENPVPELREKMIDSTKPYVLKTGGRRYRAHELLALPQIECRIFEGNISLAEFRRIELVENLQRDNLTWQEEVSMKDELFKLTKELTGETTVTAVAGIIGQTQGNLSKDIKIANAMQYMPEVAKAPTRADALKIINKAEDAAVQAELARRATLAANKEGADKRKRNLLEAYILGDAFELIARVPNESMDFVELDPPYGIGYDDLHETREDRNQNVVDFKEWTAEEYVEFLTKIAKESFRVLKDKTWGICWHSVWRIKETQVALEQAGFDVCKAPIIWVKAGQGRNRTPSSRFTVDYETCTYYRKGIAQLNKQGPSSTFGYQTDKSSRHPTQKPIGLLCSILECFIAPNSRILVPFLGSGNTILAASKINCLAFGFDLASPYKDSYTMAVEEFLMQGSKPVEDCDL